MRAERCLKIKKEIVLKQKILRVQFEKSGNLYNSPMDSKSLILFILIHRRIKFFKGGFGFGQYTSVLSRLL